jgi:hypothetical protein
VADDAVIPPGAESDAKAMHLIWIRVLRITDAALSKIGFARAKNDARMWSLTGSQVVGERAQAEGVAASVPNVRQVVNELQVKNQKATSSN